MPFLLKIAFVVTPLGVGLWVGNQRLTPEGVTTNNQRNCSMPIASISSNAWFSPPMPQQNEYAAVPAPQ